ncbi:MAG: CerR family C-terminal domain-containing protein [Planctomycetota bacterium]
MDPRQLADSTRDRILTKAGPIFAAKGFRGTTVREICDHANVNLASINYYFGDKQKLYNETVVLARNMRVEKVPYPDWDESTPASQKLADFIYVILERLVAMESEPWQVRLLMREILQPSEACRHLVRDYFQPFFQALLRIVDDLVGCRLPEHERSKIGFSVIGQCLFYRFAGDVSALMIGTELYEGKFDRRQLAQHITKFSLNAIEQIRMDHQTSETENAPNLSTRMEP